MKVFITTVFILTILRGYSQTDSIRIDILEEMKIVNIGYIHVCPPADYTRPYVFYPVQPDVSVAMRVRHYFAISYWD